jgi:hypothetical protein
MSCQACISNGLHCDSLGCETAERLRERVQEALAALAILQNALSKALREPSPGAGGGK